MPPLIIWALTYLLLKKKNICLAGYFHSFPWCLLQLIPRWEDWIDWSLQSSESWRLQLLFTHSLALGIIWNVRKRHTEIQRTLNSKKVYLSEQD